MSWQLTALLMDIGTMGLIQSTKSSHHILARLFLSLMRVAKIAEAACADGE